MLAKTGRESKLWALWALWAESAQGANLDDRNECGAAAASLASPKKACTPPPASGAPGASGAPMGARAGGGEGEERARARSAATAPSSAQWARSLKPWRCSQLPGSRGRASREAIASTSSWGMYIRRPFPSNTLGSPKALATFFRTPLSAAGIVNKPAARHAAAAELGWPPRPGWGPYGKRASASAPARSPSVGSAKGDPGRALHHLARA
mmetsp:Transcript_31908/g.71862  ORF Transcript_31908/g.71862 Transcript_31908/m.71862 type:complete len:210 (-) Transcript_31908:930-1559(-)